MSKLLGSLAVALAPFVASADVPKWHSVGTIRSLAVEDGNEWVFEAAKSDACGGTTRYAATIDITTVKQSLLISALNNSELNVEIVADGCENNDEGPAVNVASFRVVRR